ncbi:MAG TPA: alpha-amylase family glycosyl hydrolase, partial [Marinilabiliaceae bacterium]|nr:alpha-amylase family glycosyl hydrolase [Marinilabiliaceae bacterium]
MLKQLFSSILLASIFFSCQTASKPSVEPKNVSKTPVSEWSKDAVIYEVNTRQYTEAGTFEAFEAHLPRLKELGVDILWFMPIYPIGEKNRKGTLGSYYSIRDYQAVNPEFGTMEDFKSLVQKAHELDMKVILDWVANHTSWDHEWITTHPEWYTKDSIGNMIAPFDWTDVAQLDYTQEGVRTAMKSALNFWVNETDIDGYRCDVAGMVPVDFWESAAEELNAIKPIFMLAEDEAETDLLLKAFNANYGWEFHHIMNDIAKDDKTAVDATEYLQNITNKYPKGAYPMQFTSNHDENSWNGTTHERMGDAANTFAALTFVVEGMPLIYNGQEAGLNKRLEFFEKDFIDWSDLSASQLYSQLIKLKKENKALWNG